VTVNSAVFLDVPPCGFLVFLHSVSQLLVTAKVVPSLLILSNLMMQAIRSSKATVLRRAAWRRIPEGDILL
jgi:hypothetical protein